MRNYHPFPHAHSLSVNIDGVRLRNIVGREITDVKALMAQIDKFQKNNGNINAGLPVSEEPSRPMMEGETILDYYQRRREYWAGLSVGDTRADDIGNGGAVYGKKVALCEEIIEELKKRGALAFAAAEQDLGKRPAASSAMSIAG